VKTNLSRSQKTTVLFGILSIVLLIVVLQLWLLTASMNAYLAGNERVLWPAAIASAVGFLLNAGLLRYVAKME
jgi:hypothetical protein